VAAARRASLNWSVSSGTEGRAYAGGSVVFFYKIIQ